MHKKLQKKNKLELGSVLHEIWQARHQARPASIKRRPHEAGDSQCLTCKRRMPGWFH